MKDIWKFADIVDLNFYCRLDQEQEEVSNDDLHRRDRQIFLENRQAEQLHTSSHLQCLRLWLASRRISIKASGQPYNPGQDLYRLLQFFKYLLAACGMLAGLIAGTSYFAYTGTTPLNVFTFFLLFILPQLVLVVLFLFRSLIAGLSRRPVLSMRRVLLPLFRGFAGLLERGKLSLFESNMQKWLSKLLSQNTSALIGWPLFIHAQLFSIFFNVGLAALTFLKIATTDLAFGWQTTLQIGAEKLYSIVKILAIPWSWCLSEALSYPTLAQIEGSRIILKDTIYHLLTENLTSWWPFLLLSLLFYGLLPRLLLLFIGLYLNNRHLTRFLRQRKFYNISRRMLTPLVSTQAKPQSPLVEHVVPTAKALTEYSGSAKIPIQEAHLLVPQDISDSLTEEMLKKLLLPYGYSASQTTPIFTSYDDDSSVLQELEGVRKPLIVFLEAWMAPIREHLLFLEKLCSLLPENIPVCVCLLGRPQRKAPFTTPTKDEMHLWKKKISHCCNAVTILNRAAGAAEGRQP